MISFSTPKKFHVKTTHLEDFHEPCDIEFGVECEVVNVGDEVGDLLFKEMELLLDISSRERSSSWSTLSSSSSSDPSSASLPCASCASVSWVARLDEPFAWREPCPCP
jgi:hypothetical protein